MIPKILQFIWIWDPLPPFAEYVMDAYAKANPSWDILKITTLPLEFPADLRKFTEEPRIPSAYKCDLFRSWALGHYGGINVDMDSLPIRPFDDWLIERQCFMPICRRDAEDRGSIDVCFTGSVQGHPFWDSVINRCRHPEAWLTPRMWFCGTNTFVEAYKYGVDPLVDICQEAQAGETTSFVHGNYSDISLQGRGYMKHFRASTVLEKMLPAHKTHWGSSETWSTVYGKYPYEIDNTIDRLELSSEDRVWNAVLTRKVALGLYPVN